MRYFEVSHMYIVNGLVVSGIPNPSRPVHGYSGVSSERWLRPNLLIIIKSSSKSALKLHGMGRNASRYGKSLFAEQTWRPSNRDFVA